MSNATANDREALRTAWEACCCCNAETPVEIWCAFTFDNTEKR